MPPDQLILQGAPAVEFATNHFINTPIILQHDDTPLIEVVDGEVAAGWTTQFQIFHPDGTDLARVKGSQIYLTEAGKKANLQLRHPAGATVCELDGKTLFEIHRAGAAALKTEAELYTPNGRWVRCKGGMGYATASGEPLRLGGITMSRNTFRNLRIGVWIKSDGSMLLGVR